MEDFNINDLKYMFDEDDIKIMQPKLISNIMEKLEKSKYIDERSYKKSYENTKFLVSLINSNSINSDGEKISFFESLRNQSISKYGFVTNKFRKIIYCYILGVNAKSSDNNFYFLNKKSKSENNKDKQIYTTNNSILENYNIEKTVEKIIYTNKTTSQYTEIIRLDTLRSKLNTILPISKFSSTNVCLKQILHKVASAIPTINNERYHYCQGFHDITMIFLMLFDLNKNVSLNCAQRFAEFFMKESLNSKLVHEKFNFTIESKIVEKLIVKFDSKIASLIFKFFEEGLFFVYPWIITFFTHNLNNLLQQYRILDYILTSSPNCIYFMCATTVVTEFSKFYESFKKEFGITNDNFDADDYPSIYGKLYAYFQKIDYENYDFDDMISKTEEFRSQYHKENCNISVINIANQVMSESNFLELDISL